MPFATELILIDTDPAGIRPLDDFKNSRTAIYVEIIVLSFLQKLSEMSHR